MERETLINNEKQDFIQVYNRLPIVVERAEGCRVWDVNGTSYLDFLGGIAVNVLGHSHPKIIERINQQSKRYLHLSNYFYQDAQINFVHKLLQMTNYDRAFLTNSGTESIEGAIKLVRKWGKLNNKQNIIAFSNAFHGRTYGALSLMNKPAYKEDMGPYLPNVQVIPYNSPEHLIENLNLDTAAVFLEFIQGEGGISSVSQEFVDILKELKEQNNFLIVADEIQSGIGRTGKFFAFEHFNIIPDVVTVSKGLGGGLPLGAILIKNHLANVFNKSQHGTTFGGNALSCAVGEVVLDELNSGLMTNVVEIGNYFKTELMKVKNDFPDFVAEVRGYGLMLGLVLKFEAKKLLDKLLEKNIIANATNTNVLRIVPPLIIDKDDINEFIRGVQSSLNELSYK
jgi:predicted acetylornithine/succinylornithine family transaminase